MVTDEDESDNFLERPYQTVLADQAYDANKILFLPTGSGKTFIAIMVLKRMFHRLEPKFSEGGQRAIFVVNTVALVEQQAKVLQRHLLVDGVGMYSGDMNVDSWNADSWGKEFAQFQVMVMTAEILNRLLLNSYISLSNLALIIFDECHHAVEDHPMRQIMRLFEDCPVEKQPRIIGLTATLLNSTPKSLERMRNNVKNLEVTLHSTVATVNSWDLVKQFSTKPIENIYHFEVDISSAVENFIINKIGEACEMARSFLFVTENTCKVNFVEGFVPLRQVKKNDVANLILQVSKQLSWLGPFGCYKAAQAVFVSLKILQQKMNDRHSHNMINSLICVLVLVSFKLEIHMNGTGCPENVKAYLYSSSKVKMLLRLLENHNNDCNSKHKDSKEPMQALVFVEEKMTAKILCSLLKNVARGSERYSFIKAAFIVGGSYNPFSETWEGSFNKQVNDHIVRRFREKEINVLVSTDVLEEGIDIPACNLVVRFDSAKSFRSYVQSKGRARHSSSLFCLMTEKSNMANYEYQIKYFKEIEGSLEQLLVGHTDDRLSPSKKELQDLYDSEIEPYYTPVGSKVTLTSAISLVNRYCLSLAHDRFSKVTPFQYMRKNGDQTIVAMQLPKLSSMQDLVKGPPMGSLKMAKRAAALVMSQRLHEVGELNDNLLPNEKYLEESDFTVVLPLWQKEEVASESLSKTGSTKRVREYPLLVPSCFQDCAPIPQKQLYMHHIEMYPAYDKPSCTDHRKFTIYSALQEKRNFAMISLKPLPQVCGFPIFSKFGVINVRVNSSQIALSEDQLMDITHFHFKLFTSMVPMARSFLSFSKSSYLLAATKYANGRVVLDWDGMTACRSEYEGKEVLLKHIITPAHRPSNLHEVYFVTQICQDLNGCSPFPSEEYKSYKDYFQKRHGYSLRLCSAPLVEVQPFQQLSNDLLPRQKNVGSQNDAIHFPAEVCKVKCIDGSLYLKATFLPSLLHRIERYTVAEELYCIFQRAMGISHADAHDCILSKSEILGRMSAPSSTCHAKCARTVSFVNQETPAKRIKKPDLPLDQFDGIPDIEHDFETLTASDIEKYGRFAQKKISSANSPFQAENKVKAITWMPPALKDKEGEISLLVEGMNSLHPCHILEATTSASADDIVNFERLETLGDSFLKFAVSLMLFIHFPDLSEGKLTQVKGQILGNRNLFYCAQAKALGCYLKVQKMVPSEKWVPPSFSVHKDVSINNLGHMIQYLILSEKEQFNNVINSSSLNDLKMRSLQQLTFSEATKVPARNHQAIPDKTIADCVEALIGVFLSISGPKAAMQFLEYMRILPPGSKDLLQVSPQFSTFQFSRLSDPGFSRTVSHIHGILGYTFRDANLLIEALTHASSPSSSKTYERLEFVGDAILDFLITAFIYENCGNLSPGELTDLRSALVNNVTFACLSVRCGLYKLMNQGSIALMEAVDKFVQFQEARHHLIDEEILILLEEAECKIADCVDVPKALGDLFEALIGAVYLDSGKNLEAAWKAVYRLMKEEIGSFSHKVPKQVVRRLYEALGQHSVSFRVSESTKEAQILQVHVVLDVQIEDEVKTFHGFGANKASAKKSAAKLALRQLSFS